MPRRKSSRRKHEKKFKDTEQEHIIFIGGELNNDDNNSENNIKHICKDCILCNYDKYSKQHLKHINSIKKRRIYSRNHRRSRKFKKSHKKMSINSKKKLWDSKSEIKVNTTGNFVSKYGSRTKVMHGYCEMTAGGLRKEDLCYNSSGKIVSKKCSEVARKNRNLGIFLVNATESTYFSKSPKVGTSEYNKIINEEKNKKK
jgi:hypothetical protein